MRCFACHLIFYDRPTGQFIIIIISLGHLTSHPIFLLLLDNDGKMAILLYYFNTLLYNYTSTRTLLLIIDRRRSTMPLRLLQRRHPPPPCPTSHATDNNCSRSPRPASNSTGDRTENEPVHCNPAAGNTQPPLPSDTGHTGCWCCPTPHPPHRLIDPRSYVCPTPKQYSLRASKSRTTYRWPW